MTTDEGIEGRWLVSSDSSTDPYTLLVLNLRTMQWTIDVLSPLVSPRVDTYGAIGNWAKGCVLAHSDLTVSYPIRYQESDVASAVDDSGGTSASYVQSELRTSWQHPWGVGRWGRLDHVYVNLDGSDYTVSVTVETDGQESGVLYTKTVTFDLSAAANPYWTVEIGPRQRQCSSVRVTIKDTQLSAANSTFGVNSIVLDAHDENRVKPLPNSLRK